MGNWWVNQNQTYKFEVPGGFLWSPKTNKNGSKNQFYDNMALVQPGDLVFLLPTQKFEPSASLSGRPKLRTSQTLATLVRIGRKKAGWFPSSLRS